VAAGAAAVGTRSFLLWLPERWLFGPVEIAPFVASLVAFTFWFGALTGAFTFREGDDAFRHGMEDAEGQGLRAQLKASWASFTGDGYFDLVSPYVGFAIPVSFVWTPWGVGIFVVGSGGFVGGHKLFKGRWPWQGMD
jgi:hypothetical protein